MLWDARPATYSRAVQTFLGAKRLECAELAPAFGAPRLNDSASKLDSLQPLRFTAMPAFPSNSVFTPAHTKAAGSRLNGINPLHDRNPQVVDSAPQRPAPGEDDDQQYSRKSAKRDVHRLRHRSNLQAPAIQRADVLPGQISNEQAPSPNGVQFVEAY